MEWGGNASIAERERRLQLITFKLEVHSRDLGYLLLEVQVKVSENSSQMEQLGPCYPWDSFCWSTASICVMRTEGFDGNGKHGSEDTPRQEAMRPQSHAWKGKIKGRQIFMAGFNFGRNSGGNYSCLHMQTKHGSSIQWKRQKPQGLFEKAALF